jgi:hypothetical protein
MESDNSLAIETNSSSSAEDMKNWSSLFIYHLTLNVPHVSFTGNLASDNQSVTLSDGKIKVKRLYLNKSWSDVCLLPAIEEQTMLC